MSDRLIKPATSISGSISLPGDKSISHRALMFAGIAEGSSTITGLATAEDVQGTLKCLKNIGVEIRKQKNKVTVNSSGMYGLRASQKALDAGNSGTTIRLLSGILAAQNYISIIDGDESLRKRPMRRIIEPLETMGARIDSREYKAPLTIHGGPLRAIDYASPVASAQVKSCILLAGTFAKGLTRVTEPAPSRDHTERMLKHFGANIHHKDGMAGIKGPIQLKSAEINVPGDISAAAFFIVAGCLLPNSEVEFINVGVNQTRTGILDALAHMGAFIKQDDLLLLSNEPRARLVVKTTRLNAATFSGLLIPRIIDEIPILAVAATQAEGTTTFRDAGELRVKESDRIATIVENLKRMGANVRETKDGMVIQGPTALKGAEIDSYGDHRIAMSFSIAGLIADGETLIKNIDCVDTSFPEFFTILDYSCHA
jgi:3-phosphoshikimate 1-carboxyvinyltransferase